METDSSIVQWWLGESHFPRENYSCHIIISTKPTVNPCFVDSFLSSYIFPEAGFSGEHYNSITENFSFEHTSADYFTGNLEKN